MEAHVNQETFFSNEGNKAQFISVLSRYLESDSQSVHNSTGDADTMIVSCVLQMATEGSKEVIVVADDTDVLILLMHHWIENMADVYFLSEPKKITEERHASMENMRSDCQGWNIGDITPFVYSCMEWLRYHPCNFRAGKNKHHEEDPGIRRGAADIALDG